LFCLSSRKTLPFLHGSASWGRASNCKSNELQDTIPRYIGYWLAAVSISGKKEIRTLPDVSCNSIAKEKFVAAGPVSRILSDGFLQPTAATGLNLQSHVGHGDSWSLYSLANPMVSRSTHTDRPLNGR
jgi:hypothetical protein